MINEGDQVSGSYYLDQVKKCVTFIFVRERAGQIRPIGTGFFVSIKTKFGDAVYLVTARHVLESAESRLFDNIIVRLNTKNDSAEDLELDLSKLPVLTHTDKNVDLAVTLFRPREEYFDYLSIPQDYFTDGVILAEKNIREGSRAFFAGLFSNFYGKKRNYPVVRFGYISLLTGEKMDLARKGESPRLAHLYLVECQSLGGFSGSPVFFELARITPTTVFHSPEIYLGGVMKGHYNDIIETPKGIIRELNAGLALVTPCYLLKELLYSERAQKDLEEAAKD